MFKNNKKNKIKNSFSGIFIVIMFISIYGCSKQEQTAGGFEMPPMPVEVAVAKVDKVSDKFEAVGTIEANEAITVVSEIDAAIKSLPFEEGSYMRKGQVIAQLDDSQLAAEVSRTEALYAQTKSSYNRIKEVVSQKAGTAQDLDDAAAAMKVAEANLALAKARFEKTRIVAPFNGMIGARKVSIGTFLRVGQPITELANINEIRINFSAPEKFLAQLKKGAEVSISTSAYSGDEVRGRIIVIDPVVDPETRNARVTARVSNPGKRFLPGMSANVSAVLNERLKAILIPSEAVFATGNQSFVYKVNKEGVVAMTPVKLGLQLQNVVEVLDGINPEDKIVKAGHQKLFDGAKVMPVQSTASAK